MRCSTMYDYERQNTKEKDVRHKKRHVNIDDHKGALIFIPPAKSVEERSGQPGATIPHHSSPVRESTAMIQDRRPKSVRCRGRTRRRRSKNKITMGGFQHHSNNNARPAVLAVRRRRGGPCRRCMVNVIHDQVNKSLYSQFACR